MTPVLFVTPVLLFLLALAFIVRVVIKLHYGLRKDELTPEWLAAFSTTPYQPLQKLFGDEDFAFLSQQPGFDLFVYKKFRRDRLRIYRQYMNRLINDYNRLHAAARFVLANSLATTTRDQSDMLARLIWMKFEFAVAVFRAETSYMLCFIGFRTLAVRAAILRLEKLSSQVTRITQPA